MQMKFLKLYKERENPLEELQSMLLSVCLCPSLFVSLSVSVCRCSLCVREHVPIHTSIHTHTFPPSQIWWTLQMKRGMVSTWISINATTATST